MQMLTWFPVSVTPSLSPFLCSFCILLSLVTQAFSTAHRTAPQHHLPQGSESKGGWPSILHNSLLPKNRQVEAPRADAPESLHPPSFSTTDSTYHHLNIIFAYIDLTNWTSIYWLGKAWCWEMGWTWSSSFALLPLARVRLYVVLSTPRPSGQLLLSFCLCPCAPKRL